MEKITISEEDPLKPHLLRVVNKSQEIPSLTVDEKIRVERIPGLSLPFNSISSVVEEMDKITLTQAIDITNTKLQKRKSTFIKNKYQQFKLFR